jgi:hypothetical protein
MFVSIYRDRQNLLSVSYLILVWFFVVSCKRLHDRVLRTLKPVQECTSEFCRIQTKTCQEGALEEVIRIKGEASRLLNTLEVRLCRGRHIEKT